MKRKISIDKKVFQTKLVNVIIECQTPMEYKDLGYPTITITIRDVLMEKALLNLGANVNLSPYSLYIKKLDLRKLKKTDITLSYRSFNQNILRFG